MLANGLGTTMSAPTYKLIELENLTDYGSKDKNMEHYVRGKFVDLSFDDYWNLCSEPLETYEKSVNKGYVLAQSSEPVRQNKYVQGKVWIAVDIDKADRDIFEELVEAFHEQELDVIIHTSWSHDPERNKYRYRILVNAVDVIAPDVFKYVYQNFINSIPFLVECDKKEWIDHAMKKLSQFIFAPSVHPDRTGSYQKLRTGGVPYEVDTRNFESTNNASSTLPRLSELAGFNAWKDVVTGIDDDTSAVAGIMSEGGRNEGLTKICGGLVAKHKNKNLVLQELHGVNATRCNPPLPHDEVNTIFNSIWNLHFQNNPDDVPVTDKPKSKLVLMSVKDMMNLPDIEWLVDGLIVKKSINMIFGRSGDTKSFLGLHMGMCLATRRQFFGIGSDEEEPIDVVFNALEGAYGLKNRVDGWLQFYNQTDVPNFHITSYNPVLNNEKLVDEFIDGLRAYNLKTPLIIIDTYNQATPDLNENDAGATGTVMKNCQRIIAELNATLIIIHHSNKGENGEYRGSTALKASMDSMIKVELNNNQKMYAKWTVDKVKDGEHGVVYDYQLHKQDLGYTSKGKAKNTLVVKELGLSKAKGDRQKLGKRQLLVWNLITEYLKPNLNKSDDAMMVKEYCVARMGGIEQHRRGHEYDSQLKNFIVKKMVRVYPNSSGIEQIQIIES